MAKTIFFDVACGAAGDMILAALLDLGVPVAWLQQELDRMRIPGLKIVAVTERVNGLRAMRVNVAADEAHAHRHLPDILALIAAGHYPASVTDRCARVFDRLAEAEAKAHGIPKAQVHFHEIGAVDTIADVLGTALALDRLGVEDLAYGTLTVGSGTITFSHGTVPAPAPATLEMLRGLRCRALPVETEILTPTGCAILTALGRQAPDGLSGVVENVGCGAGTKRFTDRPNMLRAVLLKTATPAGADEVVMLESDMDHVTGEVMAFAAEELMRQGARDVSWTPIFMKKGRPGYRITVLCLPAQADALAETLIRQTRTLGVRLLPARRITAERAARTGIFQGRAIREKECRFRGETFVKPEFESLAEQARETGVPLPELMERYAAIRDADGRAGAPAG